MSPTSNQAARPAAADHFSPPPRPSQTALHAVGSTLYHCYAVIADVDPGILPRVLELIAKRGLVPYRCHSTLEGPRQDTLAVDLQVTGLDEQQAAHVAACLGQIPGVTGVARTTLHR